MAGEYCRAASLQHNESAQREPEYLHEFFSGREMNLGEVQLFALAALPAFALFTLYLHKS